MTVMVVIFLLLFDTMAAGAKSRAVIVTSGTCQYGYITLLECRNDIAPIIQTVNGSPLSWHETDSDGCSVSETKMGGCAPKGCYISESFALPLLHVLQ